MKVRASSGFPELARFILFFRECSPVRKLSGYLTTHKQ